MFQVYYYYFFFVQNVTGASLFVISFLLKNNAYLGMGVGSRGSVAPLDFHIWHRYSG